MPNGQNAGTQLGKNLGRSLSPITFLPDERHEAGKSRPRIRAGNSQEPARNQPGTARNQPDAGQTTARHRPGFTRRSTAKIQKPNWENMSPIIISFSTLDSTFTRHSSPHFLVRYTKRRVTARPQKPHLENHPGYRVALIVYATLHFNQEPV